MASFNISMTDCPGCGVSRISTEQFCCAKCEEDGFLKSQGVRDVPSTKNDPVNHPKHYTSHPSGIECIQITRHMGFNLGNALKYIWRADLKGESIQDLQKAMWYIQDEIALREKQNGN